MSDKSDVLIGRARAVIEAKTDNFAELIRLAGIDPRRHLRFADWTGVDFSGCNLNSFDFTGARLRNCNFKGATLAGARFDQAEINGANLREAVDWKAYMRNSLTQWKPADGSVRDDHLPTGAVFQDAPFAPELVVIPAGEFMMGSPPDEPERSDTEGPQHKVTIPEPLAVGRYAVTFEEWDIAQADKDWQHITRREPYKPADEGRGRDRQPVFNVNWDDAQGYVKWMRAKTGRGYRLLSEAEWEYAARAGTDTRFWWGASISPDQANYGGRVSKGGGQKSEYRRKTVPVGEFKPNGFGLYQVLGNVWEWVEDHWHKNYNGAPKDGSAWISGDRDARVLRGGSWLSQPRYLRTALRNRNHPVNRNNHSGFRLARTLNP